MGNLCGKQSKDAFDGPGRTLGSAPAPATKASVPATANAGSSAKRTVGGPPRKLGESNAVEDPRSAAAAAAEWWWRIARYQVWCDDSAQRGSDERLEILRRIVRIRTDFAQYAPRARHAMGSHS
ncbi:uncharacterized protein EKO05_0001707 [Ascochyta rabiei]|uniref:uncharacterized protein n=1 Tax=Didymella rabiei TaxID=5454 RepID=UPI00220E06BE|nr:uncharacterized protein EKO05_0001707 [Ascochyta rabiei]UPX11084.1 hypothetical protein EKO05_0001707 [Ascochyta rabiei]